MSKEEAMQEYVQLIDHMMEDLHIFPDSNDAEIASIVEKFRTFRSDLSCLQKTDKIYFEEREESSLFQPGSEVFLDKQPSLLETVQDFVQHDIVEPVVDSKSFLPITEDPLGVMEPRPGKNLSEDSLLRATPSIADIYELLVVIDKRIAAIEMRLELSSVTWARLLIDRIKLSGPILLLIKVASSFVTLLFVIRFIFKRRK